MPKPTIITVGIHKGGVGKTTFIKNYCLPERGSDLRKTIGIQFCKLKQNVNFQGDSFSLCFWDIVIRESTNSLIPLYYQGADGAIFMYDLTNEKSLDYFPEWLVDIRLHSGDIPVVLVGNKIDLGEHRMDSKNHAMMLKERFGLPSLLEISAKSGKNVDKLLEVLIRLIKNRIE